MGSAVAADFAVPSRAWAATRWLNVDHPRFTRLGHTARIHRRKGRAWSGPSIAVPSSKFRLQSAADTVERDLREVTCLGAAGSVAAMITCVFLHNALKTVAFGVRFWSIP